MSAEDSGRQFTCLCNRPTKRDSATLRSRRRASEQCINVCFIYLFAAASAACIAALILGLVVLRVRIPTVNLTSVAVKNLSYGLSPYPFMNATFIAEITIKNSNFGRFKFAQTNASLIYDGITAGVGKVKRVDVSSKGTETANFTVRVKPNASVVDIDYFSYDVAKLKTMNMSCVAEFEGRVRLLKLFNKKSVSVMNCTMTLDLKSRDVQNLACL